MHPDGAESLLVDGRREQTVNEDVSNARGTRRQVAGYCLVPDRERLRVNGGSAPACCKAARVGAR
jgi:hypothetical protein